MKSVEIVLKDLGQKFYLSLMTFQIISVQKLFWSFYMPICKNRIFSKDNSHTRKIYIGYSVLTTALISLLLGWKDFTWRKKKQLVPVVFRNCWTEIKCVICKCPMMVLMFMRDIYVIYASGFHRNKKYSKTFLMYLKISICFI